MNASHVINSGGFLGILIAIVGVALCIAGLALLLTKGSRKLFVVFAFSALLPLLLGLFGTWMGQRSVQAIELTVEPDVKQEILDEGYRITWVTTYLGIGFAIPILLVAGIGAAVGGRHERP